MVVPARCGGRGGLYPPPRGAFRRQHSFRRISEGNGEHPTNRHSWLCRCRTCLLVQSGRRRRDQENGFAPCRERGLNAIVHPTIRIASARFTQMGKSTRTPRRGAARRVREREGG